MKYFVTFFWTFLLVQMVTYVVSSMLAVPFDFQAGSILAVIFTILLFVLSAIIPEGQVEKESIH